MARIQAATVLVLTALFYSEARASDLDWDLYSDVDVIEIITSDEDGEMRETKVWFVLVDDVPILRTSGSRWLENIRRDPLVTIRIEGEEYLQMAREVTSDEMIARVDEASREKYGWQDAFIHAFRIADPDLLALSDPDL
jgi:hypothetical protein